VIRGAGNREERAVGNLPRFRILFVLAILVAGWFGSAQAVGAQPGLAERDTVVAQDGEGFPLPAFTTFCEPGYAGPFNGCTPWEGVTVSFATTAGEFATSCVTAGTDRVGSCVVNVPFGSTVVVSIDPGVVPAGYELQNAATQEILIPDGPPEGEFGGANFVLLPAEPSTETVLMPIYASLCADGLEPHDDCSPWEGSLVSVTDTADGSWVGECVTATINEFAAGCEVAVERGTSVLVNMSLDTLPVDYMLWTTQIVWDVPAEGEVGGPMFLAVPVEDETELSPLPVFASICEDALAPNDDCSPWEGVVISAETADGTFNDTCVTSTFFETVAGCEIPMPRGANVTAYISEEQIPEGYELFVEVPTWDIPAEGDLESGPYFFLVPVDGEAPAPTPAAEPTPAVVTGLPSTGSGASGQAESGVIAMMAGAGVVLMLGAGYVFAHRER
jgi:hypothetical protein